MAKCKLSIDWNFNNIGTKFELDEVIPKFETEVRVDANGEIIKTEMQRKRRFNTDKIYYWNTRNNQGWILKEINPSLSRQPDALVEWLYPSNGWSTVKHFWQFPTSYYD